jgi:two-component sensor histidine kinase
VALALILHELATNAAKYGALAASDGQLEVGWSQERRDDGHWLRLRWFESGLATPPETKREGFGTKLIRRSIEYELDGTAVRTLGPDSVLWELEFQLAPRSGTKLH